MYVSFKKNLQGTIELALKYLYLYIISFSLDHSFILQRYFRQENVSGLVKYNSYFPVKALDLIWEINIIRYFLCHFM